jgi:hypothetical protein
MVIQKVPIADRLALPTAFITTGVVGIGTIATAGGAQLQVSGNTDIEHNLAVGNNLYVSATSYMPALRRCPKNHPRRKCCS